MMKIFVVLLMGFNWMPRLQLQRTNAPPIIANNFSCLTGVRSMPLKLHNLSGYWYEAGRVPKRDVMRCLSILVPQTAVENLELHLQYTSTIAGRIEHVVETIKFPMNNYTRNSIFILHYTEGPLKLVVTYKVIYTDYKYVTLLCGFSGISPIPLFKILTRKKLIDWRLRRFLSDQLDKTKLGEHFMWTQQMPEECGSAALCPAYGVTIFLALAIIKNS